MPSFETRPLFPIPFVKTNLQREMDMEEINRIVEFANDDNNMRRNSMNLTSKDTKILERFPTLKLMLEICANQFLDFVLGQENSKLRITTSWVNITKKGEAHHKHTHPNSIVSGVVYIKTDKNSGLFCVEKPAILFPQIVNMPTTVTEYVRGSYSFTPENLDLYMFPSWLTHFVTYNESEESRISISFNTFYVGKIDTDPDSESSTNTLTF
jgi:uncharacterized protein (TIGR02466 family)